MGKVPRTNNEVDVCFFLVLNSWTAAHKGPYGVWWASGHMCQCHCGLLLPWRLTISFLLVQVCRIGDREGKGI